MALKGGAQVLDGTHQVETSSGGTRTLTHKSYPPHLGGVYVRTYS